jgi:hypothetical protein
LNKEIISHELGHAICSDVMDGMYDVDEISFTPKDEKNCYAYCHLVERKNMKFKPYRKLKDLSDLGGIFGEMLYDGKFNLWWAREDLDNFVTSNYHSKSKLVDEVEHLLNKSELSQKIRLIPRKSRKATMDPISIVVIKNNYPEIYKAYRYLERRVNKWNFKTCVNQLNFKSVNSVSKKQYIRIKNEVLEL